MPINFPPDVYGDIATINGTLAAHAGLDSGPAAVADMVAALLQTLRRKGVVGANMNEATLLAEVQAFEPPEDDGTFAVDVEKLEDYDDVLRELAYGMAMQNHVREEAQFILADMIADGTLPANAKVNDVFSLATRQIDQFISDENKKDVENFVTNLMNSPGFDSPDEDFEKEWTTPPEISQKILVTEYKTQIQNIISLRNDKPKYISAIKSLTFDLAERGYEGDANKVLMQLLSRLLKEQKRKDKKAKRGKAVNPFANMDDDAIDDSYVDDVAAAGGLPALLASSYKNFITVYTNPTANKTDQAQTLKSLMKEMQQDGHSYPEKDVEKTLDDFDKRRAVKREERAAKKDAGAKMDDGARMEVGAIDDSYVDDIAAKGGLAALLARSYKNFVTVYTNPTANKTDHAQTLKSLMKEMQQDGHSYPEKDVEKALDDFDKRRAVKREERAAKKDADKAAPPPQAAAGERRTFSKKDVDLARWEDAGKIYGCDGAAMKAVAERTALKGRGTGLKAAKDFKAGLTKVKGAFRFKTAEHALQAIEQVVFMKMDGRKLSKPLKSEIKEDA